MDRTSDDSFNDLVGHYLGERLPEALAARIPMAGQPRETRNFIRRLLRLMQAAGVPAASVSPLLPQWLSFVNAVLPGAWGGRVPPLTFAGRHAGLDAYVGAERRFEEQVCPVFLDLGCGFPPVTTADTARALPRWQVLGVDCSFPEYIVYDPHGNYACFDGNGTFLYFQPKAGPRGRAMYQDPEATRSYFTGLFLALRPEGQAPPAATEPAQHTTERDGSRLIRHHIRAFEAPNLTFVRSDIRRMDLPRAAVIRGMNLFLYFDAIRRKQYLWQAADRLEPGGLMITGTNGRGPQARYSVYERRPRGPVLKEFAFSPDNLSPVAFMPWFTIQDNDPEALALARLLRILRADREFWPEFIRAAEALAASSGIFGQKTGTEAPRPATGTADLLRYSLTLQEMMETKGFTDGAVAALERFGFRAWINAGGDIAVVPDDFLGAGLSL